MPSLPKSLAAVRSAVASLLRPADHPGSLNSVDDIANALNIAADIYGSHDIYTKASTTLLLRAFAYDAGTVVLAYDEVFGHRRDINIPYVRTPVRTGCDQGGVAVFGRLSSMEAEKRAEIVRVTPRRRATRGELLFRSVAHLEQFWNLKLKCQFENLALCHKLVQQFNWWTS